MSLPLLFALCADGSAELEREIGEAIKQSSVPREEIFITSKLYVSCGAQVPVPSLLTRCRWNAHQPNVAEGLEQTLKDLQTDYLDLYLIHWPV